MERIKQLEAELEQVQQELNSYFSYYRKRKRKQNWYSNPYVKEINQLLKKKKNLQNKINQLRQKSWYWK